MDVGLNNTNTLHIALDDVYMKDIEWIVEATSEERFNLWKTYHERYDWKDVGMGTIHTILNLTVSYKKFQEVLPICIEFMYAIIDGHKVCFYTSNARLVHHGYIEAFLTTYFQRTHHKYSRWNHTDATNFHNCINYLDTIDFEPRNTKYKPSKYDKPYFIFKKIDQVK